MAALRIIAQCIIAIIMTSAMVALVMLSLAPPIPTVKIDVSHPLVAKPIVPVPPEIPGITRDTGFDRQPNQDFGVYGTDLGIPSLSPPDSNGNRTINYWFGDTFKIAGPFLDHPPGIDHYRPQVMLRSSMMPVEGVPIRFDSAAGLEGKGIAPELFSQNHSLANDAVGLPNGDIFLSYQYLVDNTGTTPGDPHWHTYHAGFAVSHDGGDTFELMGPIWPNNEDNTDPYQMWSMQLDGEYVYIVSVRAGRQAGPMMLFRVPWAQMLDQAAYEYWNGWSWGPKDQAEPIQTGRFGEPSIRKLSDGNWVLGYTEYTGGAKVVTQYVLDPSDGPTGEWSDPKVQIRWQKLPGLYGGFIHPWSTSDNLVLMISSWQSRGKAEKIQDRELVRYDVSHIVGSI